jgi:hypothetical protein
MPFGKRDVAIAAALSLFGLLLMLGNGQNLRASGLAAPLFLAVTVPLAWRRTAPVAALSATLAALIVHVALFGTLVRCGAVFPVVFLLVFAAGARLDTRQAVLGLALGAGCVAAVCLSDAQVGVRDLPAFALITVAVWGIGRVVYARSRMVSELQARTSELRDVRDERARLEVATDRARLSVNLDELLKRRLGELAHKADEGARAADAESSAAALREIELESRRTLEQMRALVGVLRDDEHGRPISPQPTLIHLEALLVQARGDRAQLRVEGSPRALPAGVELSAYRVVEHLLAALEDGGDVVEVRVRFAEDALELSVRGRARRRHEVEIERARERVQLHHGTLRASVRNGRAEAVARLPILSGA